MRFPSWLSARTALDSREPRGVAAFGQDSEDRGEEEDGEGETEPPGRDSARVPEHRPGRDRVCADSKVQRTAPGRCRDVADRLGTRGRPDEWRDTLAIEVLEGGGSLEDVQLLLGHKSRKRTEKYCVAPTKKRMEKAIDAHRRTWDADVISVPAARGGKTDNV